MAKKRVTQEVFESIKALTDKVPAKGDHLIAQASNVSYATVHRVRKADSFEAYKQRVAATAGNQGKMEAKKAAESKQAKLPKSDIETPTFYTPTEQTAIELTRIADALERLADAWEKTPESVQEANVKRGLFGGKK